MLKRGEIEAGDILKSYDFVGNFDHYMVGTVVSNENGLIKAKTLQVFIDGVSRPDVAEEFSEFETPDIGGMIFGWDVKGDWKRLETFKNFVAERDKEVVSEE